MGYTSASDQIRFRFFDGILQVFGKFSVILLECVQVSLSSPGSFLFGFNPMVALTPFISDPFLALPRTPGNLCRTAGMILDILASFLTRKKAGLKFLPKCDASSREEEGFFC